MRPEHGSDLLLLSTYLLRCTVPNTKINLLYLTSRLTYLERQPQAEE
jgi:hypothetical protein